MIGSLQSLRFIFTIMIFLHHFPVEGKGLFFAGGPCGVSFFMILSGFVMSVGYERKVLSSSFNYISYLKKRLFRLYPLHLLCLIVPFIVLVSKSFTWNFIPSLLLIQSWIPINDVYFGGNAVAWCLSDMLFFYICFPVLIRKMSVMTKYILFKIMGVIVLCYILFLIFFPENWIHPILYISPLFRLIDFVIGILLYKLYQYSEKCNVNGRIIQLSFMTKSIVELIVVLLLVVMLIICPLLPDQFIYASYWWFAMIPLIFSFAVFNKSGG